MQFGHEKWGYDTSQEIKELVTNQGLDANINAF